MKIVAPWPFLMAFCVPSFGCQSDPENKSEAASITRIRSFLTAEQFDFSAFSRSAFLSVNLGPQPLFG